MSTLELRVLGPIEVRRGGTPVPLGGPMERAVLAALALRVGTTVQADVLIDCLWPDEQPATARRTLRTYLSRLRSRLEPGIAPGARTSIIERVGGGYRLAAARDRVDSLRFERLVAEAESALREAEPRTAATRLREALALWRGDPFGDLRYADFLALEADRLEERRSTAVELLAEAEITLGHPADVVDLLREVVARDPLRERAQRLLVEALYRSGRRNEALQQVDRAGVALREELGVDLDPELAALAARIREAPPPQLDPVDRRPVPAGPGRIIGRAAELRRLAAWLEHPGVVTLSGPPGSGKTRLAAELAWRRQERGGAAAVAWVDLAAIADPSDVSAALASALAAPGPSWPLDAEGIDALAGALGGDPPLLVLDNCEHVLPACVVLVAALVERCPVLTVLTTSREPLAIAGERVHVVEPLAVPAPDASDARLIAASPAVELLVLRASESGAQIAVSDENAAALAGIVRRLDGLPLAIELAARGLRGLDPLDLLERLDDRFDLPGPDGRVGGRHRTMESAIEWSYQRLSEPERIVFRRLSIFRGSFALREAELVCAGGPIGRADVAGLVVRLVDRSLVTTVPGGRVRYRLLEPLRAFAAAEAERHDVPEILAERHAHAYAALVEELAPQLRGPQLVATLERLDRELANVSAALRWAMQTPDRARVALRIAGGLGWYWLKRGRMREGLDWILRAQAAAPTESGRDRAAAGVAETWLRVALGTPHLAAERGAAAAAEAEGTGDDVLASWAELAAALALARQGASAEARGHAARALRVLEAAGDLEGTATALAALGLAAKYAGEVAEATERFERARALFERLGDPWDLGWTVLNLSELAARAGRLDDAQRLAQRAIEQLRRTRDGRAISTALAVLGAAALATGDLRTAEESYRAATRIAERRNYPTERAAALDGLARVAAARGKVDGSPAV